jgi:hypothetical protein
MPPERISHKQLLQGCAEPGPGDGLDPRYASRESAPRGPAAVRRKTLQLCAQIYRAIEMALCGHPEDIFRDMRVGSVVAARGQGRLLVTLVATPSALERPLEEWSEALARLAPQLRFVTAQAIHRRKVPELVLQWGQAN